MHPLRKLFAVHNNTRPFGEPLYVHFCAEGKDGQSRGYTMIMLSKRSTHTHITSRRNVGFEEILLLECVCDGPLGSTRPRLVEVLGRWDVPVDC
jgi:hypothetical protein